MQSDTAHAYQELRALIERLIAIPPGSAPALELRRVRDYLRDHCQRCGTPLDPEDRPPVAGICQTCYRQSIAYHRQRSAEDIAEVLISYQVDPAAAQRLAEFALGAPDRQLQRLNAYALADWLGLPRRPLLGMLAAAVSGGIFTLNWELYCLACEHQQATFDSLQTATSRQTCKNCHATYDAPLDEEIMVTFTIAPAIRPVAALDLAWWQSINSQYGRVSGRDILTIQGFHDLFVREPLPIHESFQITRLSVLFTDLSGSTAMYARQGDPRAYSLVQEHFNLLGALVAEAGGSLVKTIGDAIMAVFPRSSLALAAAIAAQRALAAFNQARDLGGAEALQLKIGLHCGPCLAVTLNERLDYFGTSVNVAARLQKLAAPGEVMFSADLHQSLDDPDLLQPFALQPEEHFLHGLDHLPFTLYRIAPAAV